MRILISTQDIVFPLSGGGSFRAYYTGLELKKRGHTVFMLVPVSKRVNTSEFKILAFKSFSQYKFNKLLGGFLSCLELFIKVPLLINKIDLVIGIGPISLIPLSIWGKFFNKKIIASPTDINSEYLLFSYKNSFLFPLVKILHKIEIYFIKHSDIIFTVTKEMKSYLIKKGIPPNKIYVVYDGYNFLLGEPEKIKIKSKKSKKERYIRIIHHGDLSDFEGGEEFIQILNNIITKNKNIKVIITGENSYIEKLKKLATDLEIDNKVFFSGWVKIERLKKLLLSSDIGVILKKDILGNHLITTLKIFDYWASRTIPIVPELRSIKEIATNKEVVFYKPGDFNDLEWKLEYTINHIEKFNRLKVNGFKKILNFNFRMSGIHIANIIEQKLLKQSKRR